MKQQYSVRKEKGCPSSLCNTAECPVARIAPAVEQGGPKAVTASQEYRLCLVGLGNNNELLYCYGGNSTLNPKTDKKNFGVFTINPIPPQI